MKTFWTVLRKLLFFQKRAFEKQKKITSSFLMNSTFSCHFCYLDFKAN